MENLNFVPLTEEAIWTETEKDAVEYAEYVKGEREVGLHFCDTSPLGSIEGFLWFSSKKEMMECLCNGGFIYNDFGNLTDNDVKQITALREAMQTLFSGDADYFTIGTVANKYYRNIEIDWMGNFVELEKEQENAFDFEVDNEGEDLVEFVNRGVM